MPKKKTQQDGITLLITLLLMGALLAISASLLNITLKQFQLAGLISESEVAFQAASAAMDCALYWDYKEPNKFAVPANNSDEQTSDVSMNCMGDNDGGFSYSNPPYIDPTPAPPPPVGSGPFTAGVSRTLNGGEMRFYGFRWGNPLVCSQVSIYKFNGGSEVVVDGRELWDPGGVNTCPTGATCTVVRARGYNVDCDLLSTAKRVVERELVQVY